MTELPTRIEDGSERAAIAGRRHGLLKGVRAQSGDGGKVAVEREGRTLGSTVSVGAIVGTRRSRAGQGQRGGSRSSDLEARGAKVTHCEWLVGQLRLGGRKGSKNKNNEE